MSKENQQCPQNFSIGNVTIVARRTRQLSAISPQARSLQIQKVSAILQQALDILDDDF